MRITSGGNIEMSNSSIGNDSGGRSIQVFGSDGTSAASLRLVQVWNGLSYPGNIIISADPGAGAASSRMQLQTSYFNGTLGAPVTQTGITINYLGLIQFNQYGAGFIKSNASGVLSVDNTSYQPTITLTTTGSSGAATFDGTTLNIPNYGSALSGYVPYTGATEGVNLGVYGLTATRLTVTKSNNVAAISFPNPSGKNDPAYIEHDETTTNTGIMRFSVSDDDGTTDYFVFGNTAGTSGAYLERFRITSNGIVNLGTWQGSAIADAYISSAATWNAKIGGSGSSSHVPLFTGASTIGNSNITQSSGCININTSGNTSYNLFVNGTIGASAFYEASDIRFKNVLETNPSISALGIDVIKYTRNGSDQIRYGYSAQQVKSVLPDAVFGDDELTVNYSDVHTLKIASLEKRVAELELRLKSTI
jgi:hypothetical protein